MSDDYYRQLKTFFEQQVRFNRRMGLVVEELAPGLARLRFPFQEDFMGDPLRQALHGGVVATIIDLAGGMAVFTRLSPGDACSTIDLRVDYYLPAESLDLVAEARLARLGNRVAVSNIEVIQPGRSGLIAEGRGAYAIKNKALQGPDEEAR